jgi:bifunctional non-homologous end joining protein LigD
MVIQTMTTDVPATGLYRPSAASQADPEHDVVIGPLRLSDGQRLPKASPELVRHSDVTLFAKSMSDVVNKLSTYLAKRDFTRTAEPRGDASPRTGKRLRFVVQKHDATRLHYDFRLELAGVFRSWAVTKGPSLNPHDKRLAVEVEDHPLEYGDFEGTIPDGEYGGGTVQIWDRGYWSPEGMTPEEGLARGDLKFTLQGQRLHGSWVLVRMKHDRTGGKRVNWLLIKHRDEFTREDDDNALLQEDRSVASGRMMAEIAAGKGGKPKPFVTAAKR